MQPELEPALLLEALNTSPPVSLRLNTAKPFIHDLTDKVPWSKEGYYLPERPLFALDPLWHSGAYYVQEAGSMFLEAVLKQLELPSQPRVLDLCAAPGGKSTLLASHLQPLGGWLVANEVIKNRAWILAENLIKWGLPATTVVHNTPEELGERAPGVFDLVVVDAPCSGEGMFRKDPAARLEWSSSNVKACALRQEGILDAIAPAIASGGYLIYSTCTFNREENEAVVAKFCEVHHAELVSLFVPDAWNIAAVPCAGGEMYKFLPHKTRGEGFSIAVISMPGTGNRAALKSKRHKFLLPKTAAVYRDWIQSPEEYDFLEQNDKIYAFPTPWKEEMIWAQSHLNLLHTGIPLAQQAGKTYKPLPELAFSTALEKTAFLRQNLLYEEALRYLAREDIPVRIKEKGIGIAEFGDLALGFNNLLGSRYNNLYPKAWRLRMRLEQNAKFTLAKTN